MVGAIKVLTEIKFFDNVVHLEDIVIDRNFRGNGIGKEMVEQVMKIVPECYKIVLGCKDDLEKFYVKCGFEVEGKHFCKRIKNQ